MLEIPQLLEQIENVKTRKSMLAFYKELNEHMLPEYPGQLRGLYSEAGDLGKFVKVVMNLAVGIFQTQLADQSPTFTLDDVIIVSFSCHLDIVSRISRRPELKDVKDIKPEFIAVSEWPVDPYAQIVSLLAKSDILLSNEQLHAITFRAGGWSEFRRSETDLSQLAALLHAAYLLALKFKISDLL